MAEINAGFMLDFGYGKADLWPRRATPTHTTPTTGSDAGTCDPTQDGTCPSQGGTAAEAPPSDGADAGRDDREQHGEAGAQGTLGQGDEEAWAAYRNARQLVLFLGAADNVSGRTLAMCSQSLSCPSSAFAPSSASLPTLPGMVILCC